MGWLTKIFKGSGHNGHYHGNYGNDRYREQPQNSLDDLTDIEREEIDCAIALSLSEVDQKGKKVIDVEDDSDEDRRSPRAPSEDRRSSRAPLEDEQSSRAPSEDRRSSRAPSQDRQSSRAPSENARSSNAPSEVDEDDGVKVEDLDQTEDDEQLAKAIQETESQLEEDELLAKAIQESLILETPPAPAPAPAPAPPPPPPPPRHDTGNGFPPLLPLFSSGYRICAGCNTEIGRGRFLSCMGGVWHPECFRCRACNLPITDYEFSMSDNRPYHKSCYKEQHHPKCDVCNNFIPTNPVGLIEYRAHPFWLQKYCPSHEWDGTPRCCSCERMEPRDTRYLSLDDGRKLCLKCLDSSIMDTHECQPLYLEIQEFYEGLNMKLEQQIPLLLVERQALNEAMEGEKNGHHHLAETRGLCLSEEQCVTTIIRRPRIGAGYQIMDMVTEPYRLVRQCEVTAILILYGLPRLLTGSILAHELMHAWLRLKGYPNLRPEVEEGICQVLAHMWLDSEIYSSSGSEAVTASSSSSSSTLSSSTASSSKKGKRSDFEKKLGDYFKHQIESDTSSAYGEGFRLGNQAVLKYELRRTLDHIRLTGSFPE